VQSKAHEAKGLDTTAQSGRDKFMALNQPEMPGMITAWVAALAAVDRSHPPYCGTSLPQLYVLPEPGVVPKFITSLLRLGMRKLVSLMEN
jgi:hypothetical protein